MSNPSRDLEILVAKIQAQLAPNAKVQHDAKIRGYKTGVIRQVDVLVRQRIGQYELLIVLECKDHKKPIDVKGIGAFHELLDDVGGHKGAMVCPRGFTKAAKTRAEGYQIDLYSPVDTDPHKWQARVTAPVLFDCRNLTIAFGISGTTLHGCRLPKDFPTTLIVYDRNGLALGTPYELAEGKWSNNKLPDEPGEHREFALIDHEVFVDNGFGARILVSISLNIHVQRRLYFGDLAISHYSGFRDEISGNTFSNSMTTAPFHPRKAIKEWQLFDDETKLPRRPLFTIVAQIGDEDT